MSVYVCFCECVWAGVYVSTLQEELYSFLNFHWMIQQVNKRLRVSLKVCLSSHLLDHTERKAGERMDSEILVDIGLGIHINHLLHIKRNNYKKIIKKIKESSFEIFSI